MTASTMEMWARLEPTDPKYTKAFDRGGFKGTATNGTYILKRLTEEFGPCGRGWKFVLDHEQILDGHTLKNGDRAKLHVVRGHLEYRIGDAEEWFKTSPQFGQTMLVGENRHGAFTDEEAPKKSITDCISKCAVLLGIAADVHLGLFDDNKYVNSRRAEEAAQEQSAQPQKPEPVPDVNFARTVYESVLEMVKNAKSNLDIDDILKANGQGLRELQAAAPANFQKLRQFTEQKRIDLNAALSVPEVEA